MTYEFPVLAVIGTLGVSMILLMVVLTHEIGRIAGPSWIIACFIYYAIYRRKKKLPVFGALPHDWEGQQQQVLEDAEEFDLLERYRAALATRDRARIDAEQ
jgi:APA family basic amino acid/polyamine antiporter